MTTKDKHILAADVGGTKTLLALYGEGKAPLRQRRYESSEYGSIEAVVADFLEGGEAVTVAVFGVAAPVFNGRAECTNLGWQIDAGVLKEEFNISEVRLLNDIVAASYALDLLGSDDLVVLQSGEDLTGGNLAIISPGTGLGEALVFVDDNGIHRPIPSEGGHADFAPSCKEEIALYKFLSKHYGHVSYERVLSGSGIEAIYDFLVSSCKDSDGSLSAAQITDEALKGAGDGICKKALKIFTNVLAREAGNLALKGLTTGGVYIGGGIAPKIVELIDTPEFLAAFSDKGRFKDILLKVPLYVITNPCVVVIGAREYAKRLVK